MTRPDLRRSSSVAEITEDDHRFSVLDSPTTSDIDYDTKMRDLRALEEQIEPPAAGPGKPDSRPGGRGCRPGQVQLGQDLSGRG